MATFERASTREEILSSLHQSVVEVLTLGHSTSPSYNLGLINYKPEALAAINSTAIEFDDTGKQIVLKYKNGGKQLILEAISGHDKSLSSPVSAPENADPEAESSEAMEELSAVPDQSFQELQLQEADVAAQDMNEGHTQTPVGNKEDSNARNGNDYKENVGDLRPQKRIAYDVTSLDFITMPLEPLQLRFSVSSSSKSLTVLTQWLSDHQAVVPADRTSHTRSSDNLFQDSRTHLPLS